MGSECPEERVKAAGRDFFTQPQRSQRGQDVVAQLGFVQGCGVRRQFAAGSRVLNLGKPEGCGLGEP